MKIGMTSWSIRPKNLLEALDTARTLGMDCVHLGFFDDVAVAPATIEGVQAWLAQHSVRISATCVAFAGEDYSTLQTIRQTGGYLPDELFEQRLARTRQAAACTRQLGVKILATHVGFIPEDAKAPMYGRMVQRVRAVCDLLAEHGLTLAMESGQETAEGLLHFLGGLDRDNVAVNFDPANMILYGNQEPLEALRLLRPHVVHTHMKDARWTAAPGTWGTEVPLGEGEAHIDQILEYLHQSGYQGALVIEREAGDDRAGDIQRGREFILHCLQRLGIR